MYYQNILLDKYIFLPKKFNLFFSRMLGVPVKVLHEAEGHIVTVETATGELYRGVLIEAEDNMNMQVFKYIRFAYFFNNPSF